MRYKWQLFSSALLWLLLSNCMYWNTCTGFITGRIISSPPSFIFAITVITFHGCITINLLLWLPSGVFLIGTKSEGSWWYDTELLCIDYTKAVRAQQFTTQITRSAVQVLTLTLFMGLSRSLYLHILRLDWKTFMAELPYACAILYFLIIITEEVCR